jgi:hypothetical protein
MTDKCMYVPSLVHEWCLTVERILHVIAIVTGRQYWLTRIPGEALLCFHKSHSTVIPNVLAAQHACFYEGALPHGIDAGYPVEVR